MIIWESHKTKNKLKSLTESKKRKYLTKYFKYDKEMLEALNEAELDQVIDDDPYMDARDEVAFDDIANELANECYEGLAFLLNYDIRDGIVEYADKLIDAVGDINNVELANGNTTLDTAGGEYTVYSLPWDKEERMHAYEEMFDEEAIEEYCDLEEGEGFEYLDDYLEPEFINQFSINWSVVPERLEPVSSIGDQEADDTVTEGQFAANTFCKSIDEGKSIGELADEKVEAEGKDPDDTAKVKPPVKMEESADDLEKLKATISEDTLTESNDLEKLQKFLGTEQVEEGVESLMPMNRGQQVINEYDEDEISPEQEDVEDLFNEYGAQYFLSMPFRDGTNFCFSYNFPETAEEIEDFLKQIGVVDEDASDEELNDYWQDPENEERLSQLLDPNAWGNDYPEGDDDIDLDTEAGEEADLSDFEDDDFEESLNEEIEPLDYEGQTCTFNASEDTGEFEDIEDMDGQPCHIVDCCEPGDSFETSTWNIEFDADPYAGMTADCIPGNLLTID